MSELKALVLVSTAAAAIASTQTFAQAKMPEVAQQAGMPFSHTESRSGCTSICTVQFPGVPEGKMLVVQHLAAFAFLASSTETQPFAPGRIVASGTLGPSDQTVQWFQMNHRINASLSVSQYVANIPILAFVMPGSLVSVGIETAANSIQVTLSGYLVDVPK